MWVFIVSFLPPFVNDGILPAFGKPNHIPPKYTFFPYRANPFSLAADSKCSNAFFTSARGVARFIRVNPSPLGPYSSPQSVKTAPVLPKKHAAHFATDRGHASRSIKQTLLHFQKHGPVVNTFPKSNVPTEYYPAHNRSLPVPNGHLRSV